MRIKNLDASHFWALGHLLMLQNWLKPIKGHNGPGDWNKVCHIHNIRHRSIKILDFVPFYNWMVLENSFLEFVFEIFCKTEKQFFDRRVPPLDKNWGYEKIFFFSQKNKSFSFWICILHILSFILRYTTPMYVNFSNFDLFLLEIFHFLPLYFGSQYGQN